MEVNENSKERLDRHFEARLASRRKADSETDIQQSIKTFWANFNALKADALHQSVPNDQILEEKIKAMQKLVTNATVFLPPYDVRLAQEVPPPQTL